MVLAAIREEKTMFFRQVSKAHKPRNLWKNIKNNVTDFKAKDRDISPHLKDPDGINAHYFNIPTFNVDDKHLRYFSFCRYGSAIFKLRAISE